jgi:hypothetical protein
MKTTIHKSLLGALIGGAMLLSTGTSTNAASPLRSPMNSGSFLIASYDLDDRQGAIATDDSRNGFNATLNNDASWTRGKRKGGLQFVRGPLSDQSQASYAEAVGPMNLPNNEVTFSMWYRGNSADWQALLSDPTCCNYRMLLYPGGRPYINAGQHADWYLDNVVLETNRWYHIALTIKGGGSARLYIDGALAAETSSPTFVPSTLPALSGLVMGSGERTSGFFYGLDGKLDEVRVYSRELSAQQIVRDMRGRKIKFNDQAMDLNE